MTDELDVLRHERDVIEPDPQFRAELMDRLRRDLAASDPAAERAPMVAPLERSDGEGPHRLRRLVAVAAVIALIAVGVAMVQGGEPEPNVATGVDPDDQALADGSVLAPEDAGELWAPASPDQEAQLRAEEDGLEGARADCLRMDVSDLHGGRATARSVFVSEDNGNAQHVVSTATVFGSAAEAEAMVDRMGSPDVQRCYGDAIEQQIVERARGGLRSITGRSVSGDDLEVSGSRIQELHLTRFVPDGQGRVMTREIEDPYNAFLLTVTLSAGDVEIDVHSALTFVAEGPVVEQLSALTYFTPYIWAPDTSSTPADAEPQLPEPGQQPADVAAAEAQVRLAYTGIYDTSRTREARSQFSERPRVWIAAIEQLEEGEFAETVEGMSAVVEEVVFVDPTHAAVRFQLRGPQGEIPQATDIGRAVLVDGRWLVSIQTTCLLVDLAGVACDLSL